MALLKPPTPKIGLFLHDTLPSLYSPCLALVLSCMGVSAAYASLNDDANKSPYSSSSHSSVTVITYNDAKTIDKEQDNTDASSLNTSLDLNRPKVSEASMKANLSSLSNAKEVTSKSSTEISFARASDDDNGLSNDSNAFTLKARDGTVTSNKSGVSHIPLSDSEIEQILFPNMTEVVLNDPSLNYFNECMEKVSKGDTQAMFELSKFYLLGKIGPRDVHAALEILQCAAEDVPEAALLLGEIELNGRFSADVNEHDGFLWLKRAADSDLAEAQYKLALCFLKGKGTKPNSAFALYWAQKAAEHQYAPSKNLVRYLSHTKNYGDVTTELTHNQDQSFAIASIQLGCHRGISLCSKYGYILLCSKADKSVI